MNKSKSPQKPEFPAVVFADGACSGNPGPGGWGAILATEDGKVWELGGGAPETTNNQMELTATFRALEKIAELSGAEAAQFSKIAVYTDSVYVIRGLTQWSWGWRKNGWKTADGQDVANRDLWQRLIAVVAKLGGPRIRWHYVRGHTGVPGNERVDEIAVAFSKGIRPRLYAGPLLGYGVAIHDIPDNTDLPDPKPKKEKAAAAFSYLSLIGGTVVRHRNWTSCERRVKGQSGAKFKKAASSEDEAQILRDWGVKADDIRDEQW